VTSNVVLEPITLVLSSCDSDDLATSDKSDLTSDGTDSSSVINNLCVSTTQSASWTRAPMLRYDIGLESTISKLDTSLFNLSKRGDLDLRCTTDNYRLPLLNLRYLSQAPESSLHRHTENSEVVRRLKIFCDSAKSTKSSVPIRVSSS